MRLTLDHVEMYFVILSVFCCFCNENALWQPWALRNCLQQSAKQFSGKMVLNLLSTQHRIEPNILRSLWTKHQNLSLTTTARAVLLDLIKKCLFLNVNCIEKSIIITSLKAKRLKANNTFY